MAKNTFTLAQKVALLKIPPNAWDAIIPHGPKVSQNLVDYMAACVVRDMARLTHDRAVQSKLTALGREMAAQSSKGLVNGWEDGDDICPPWPPFPPIPWPHRDEIASKFDAQTPWTTEAVDQSVLAGMLISLASVTSSQAFAETLKATAVTLAKTAASHLVEEMEGTKIKPRSVTGH